MSCYNVFTLPYLLTEMMAVELHWKLLSGYREAWVRVAYQVCSPIKMNFLITGMVAV